MALVSWSKNLNREFSTGFFVLALVRTGWCDIIRRMTVHILKLSVGIDSLSHLAERQRLRMTEAAKAGEAAATGGLASTLHPQGPDDAARHAAGRAARELVLPARGLAHEPDLKQRGNTIDPAPFFLPSPSMPP